MKNWKHLFLLLALFAFSAAATSCSDDDPVNTEQNDKPDKPDQPDQPDKPDQPDEPDQPDQPDKPVESELPKLGEVYSLVEFLGVDENDASIGYLAIYVSSQTLGIDDNDNFTGTGSYIAVMINIEVPESGVFEGVPAGTYPVNKTQSAVIGTVASSIYYAVENSKELVSRDTFTDGSLTIQSLGGERYKLVYDFVTEGGYTVKDECTTTLTEEGGDEDADYSTLTGDVTVGTLTDAAAGYFGPNSTPSVSDYYTVILSDGTADLNGETIFLSFNVTPGAKGGVPAGTYPIIDPYYTEGFSFSTVEPFTATAGFFPSEESIDGCWYFNLAGETPAQARLCSGDIEVSTDGTNYTFAGKLCDYYGNAVTFSYTGAVQFEDLTQAQSNSRLPLMKSAAKRSLRSPAAGKFPARCRF